MAKVTNIILSEKISARIDDILEKTGFTLLGLAVFTDIGKSAIKSYHSKTIPISVETVDKICERLSISLVEFFDFESEIILLNSAIEEIKYFKERNKENVNEYFSREETNAFPVLKDNRGKWEIKVIAYIVLHTPFFKTTKTTAEVQEYLETKYSVSLNPDRIYKLLKKHVGVSLIQGQTNRINKDGSISTQMVATYIKK
ncbi:hypothetical protein [Sphingobacterium sp. UBA7625]|uniref:hypothetical protein n=1 Tax=Sphingobacterium sp. UBA7625 TaxID=1947522 RepID=UPI00257C4062|nr:hypothetical protein [Sphingobacterium sp. UBA7625]